MAAGLAAAGGDDPPTTTATTAASATTGVSTTAAATATSAPGGSSATQAPTTTGSSDGGATAARAVVPAGWARHTDPEAGYTIAHPPGWQVRRVDGTRITDLTDPRTGTYMRVDWTKEPGDPLTAWQEQAKRFSSRPGYQELRLEETEFQGHPGAIWEYRYNGGGRLHASNLTFVTSEDRAYALNFQTADGRWESSQTLRRQIEDSFQVTRTADDED